MTKQNEPASVVAARQLAHEAHEARRDSGRTRTGARRLASARALRDAVRGARELTGASAGS
ncbi:hypothetical protein [Klenkia terrae]|jgi:hypothetical protein|uniref:Uncharacterized protein n=1 Tax=Klenkia terrae TaxID=1052259 RepID=A0ABU8EBS7_9ACTN|nr:hypothetical protein [Klenkia terrae]SSC25287.1 Hypothetical protein KLENKIAIHU_3911 [Klenkia terrae]